MVGDGSEFGMGDISWRGVFPGKWAAVDTRGHSAGEDRAARLEGDLWVLGESSGDTQLAGRGLCS